MMLVVLTTSCGSNSDIPDSSIDDVPIPTKISVPIETSSLSTELEESEPEVHRYSDEDVEALVLTLAGECYDDKPHDKRLVCEVVLNRVSKGFGDTVLEVVSAPNQFKGYWRQSRPVTENDYEVAIQALEDWYDNNCEALSNYLYFCAGENRENVFREDY